MIFNWLFVWIIFFVILVVECNIMVLYLGIMFIIFVFDSLVLMLIWVICLRILMLIWLMELEIKILVMVND